MPSRRDKHFLELAFKVAQTSVCGQRHGAVLTKNSRVLSLGVNSVRNNPCFVESDTGPNERGTIFSEHAEISALRRVQDARGAVMYIARCSRIGLPAYSRPCEACTRALIRAGIKAIVYT